FAPGLRQSCLGLRKSDAVLAVVKLGEQLALLHAIAFMHQDSLNDPSVNGADDAAFGGDHRGVCYQGPGPRDENEQRSDDPGALEVLTPASLGHNGEETLFLVRERLEEIRQRHLLVELRIANSNRGLIGEDGYRFLVALIEEIGFAAQKRQGAESSLVVAQRESVEALVLVGFQKRDNLSAGLIRLQVPAISILVRRDGTFQIRYPFQARAQLTHLSRFGNFGLSRNGAQHKAPAVEEADHAAVKRHDRGGILNNSSEDVVQIERGSDFLGNFQQRVEGVDLALGFEQVGVVQ